MSFQPSGPRRVLFMISSMRGGGSEQQTLLLLRHLDRTRFEPHLYLTQRAGDLIDRIPSDVPVHSLDDATPASGFYFPGRALRRQVRHLESVLREQAIDVIYDRTFHMTLIAGPAAKSVDVPRVSTIVSPPEVAVPLVESRFVRLKQRRLAKAYRESWRVIAVSEAAARSAGRYYGIASDHVEVIPNPVDAEMVRQAAGDVDPGDTSNRSDTLSLVCVGRMTKEKGHLDLISALIATELRWPERTPSIHLQFVGDGPLRREIETRWRNATCRHSLVFLGHLSNPAPLIASADALVLPSHFEGMPNVVLEAMALGTPVIATRAGGTVELERDEPTILWAEPNSPLSLADALIEFATGRESAEARCEAATRMVAEHHDANRTTRRVEQLLAGAAES